MVAIWAPETAGDLARIHAFNTDAFDIEEADCIEQFILDAGNQLKPSAGWRWKGLPIRKVIVCHPQRSDRLGYQYMLFFRQGEGRSVQIVAVYHVREDWTVLVPHRAPPR